MAPKMASVSEGISKSGAFPVQLGDDEFWQFGRDAAKTAADGFYAITLASSANHTATLVMTNAMIELE